MNYKKTLLPIILLSLFMPTQLQCKESTILKYNGKIISSNSTNDNTPLSVKGTAIALIAGNIAMHFMLKTVDSSKYPYFYDFINSIDLKHPQLGLTLLSYRFGQAPTSMLSIIMLPKKDINKIEYLHKKKIDGDEPLTEREKILLDGYEYVILHEATHINKCHIIKRTIAATGAALIGSYLWNNFDIEKWNLFNSSHEINIPWLKLDYKKTINKIICPATITGIFGYYALSQKHEWEADSYGNNHAEKEILIGGAHYFNKIDNDISNFIEQLPIPNFLRPIGKWIAKFPLTHPRLSARIKEIKKKIKKRFPNNTQPDNPTPAA